VKTLFGKKRDDPAPLFDTTRGDSITTLLDRLAATIAWYWHTADNDAQSLATLRSPGLSPDILAGSRRDVVASVAHRRWCIMQLHTRPAQAQRTLAGGKFLLYFPDGNLADGAAELETEGFFDCNNLPPWSLWLAYLYEAAEPKNYLVCWVPPAWVDIAARGIWVNPEDCIRWLSLEDHVLIHALESAGLAVLSEAE